MLTSLRFVVALLKSKRELKIMNYLGNFERARKKFESFVSNNKEQKRFKQQTREQFFANIVKFFAKTILSSNGKIA